MQILVNGSQGAEHSEAATYGDVVTVQCRPGYVLEGQDDVADKADAYEVRCGASPAPQAACSWEVPARRCVRANECDPAWAPPETVARLAPTADKDAMTGQCTPGRLSTGPRPRTQRRPLPLLRRRLCAARPPGLDGAS